ncbi:3-ketoacyl-CoA thiolase @ Acetyl-CoA acetyltransferase [hydrothermal vent metagenome]|uniref:3-ketoacyl-CoA thiolase @ Acetyl-CoA acetyltransferase n=1 Tax=hydrothermal vent metagenome TaxID=652676 RepID=A0A3B1CVA2_9ZZZZ
MRKVIVASAVRTPIGRFQGALVSLSATELGSAVIREAVRRALIPEGEVNEVLMGNVLSAGLGQAPARQAAMGAGLPEHVPCSTLNKVCGSGLKTVMMAAQAIAVGDAEIVVAGGMESMSHAPYLLDRARTGYRLGDGKLIDSLIHDGLWDVYNNFHMGIAAEQCVSDYKLSRGALDDCAIESYSRAQEAQKRGDFKREILTLSLKDRKGERNFFEDEEPSRVNFDRLRQLKAAFTPEGKVTAGNASPLSDGASALVLMSEAAIKKWGSPKMASIAAYTGCATAPERFTIAPVAAIQSLLKKTNLSLSEIDFFEINEAFAASSLAVMQDLALDAKKVNLRGGAIALGHPIGASGSRILTTLLHLLEDHQRKRGIASLCIGGGEALALLVERNH